jgi:hypothetical protein
MLSFTAEGFKKVSEEIITLVGLHATCIDAEFNFSIMNNNEYSFLSIFKHQ